MTTPIWFLDVDGVVNAFGDDLPTDLVATQATTEGIDWSIHYDPEVVAFINRVHRDGLAEVRWLTTWGQDARTSLAPVVGLDDFSAYPMHDSRDWWKAEVVVQSIAAEERPILWTDDDLSAEHLADLDGAGVPALGVAPVPERGLTEVDVGHIETFLRSLADTTEGLR